LVRHRYVEQIVYDLYKTIPSWKFPLKLEDVVRSIPNCRYLSYQRVAVLSRKKFQEVIDLCESTSGCTFYDSTNDRYLILTNQAVLENNAGRRRWTLGHEIGHVMCGHFKNSSLCKLSENGLATVDNPEFEREADYFAASFLSPIPFFPLMNIRVADDVMRSFGLSKEASRNRINDYARWKRCCPNPEWETKMQRLFIERGFEKHSL